jgi:threonylcarbamoyladenosine tRNA methylthiotransferase MtaB
VIENAQKLLDTGYKEIVLTGVNTGDYNYDDGFNKFKLIDVLYELEKLNVPRLRISSIEPNLLTDEIIQLVKESKNFCKHFHIPLQSGDTETLKLMRRRYNRNYYEELVHKLNSEIPNIGIGVDVIVGFPGETDEKFNNTYNFLNKMPVSYLHVFTYSERKNTFAVTLPGSVGIRVRKQRSRALRELSSKKRYSFYLKNAGKTHNVLFEAIKDDGYIYGFTENYIKIRSRANKELENKILPLKITGAEHGTYAEGEVLSH